MGWGGYFFTIIYAEQHIKKDRAAHDLPYPPSNPLPAPHEGEVFVPLNDAIILIFRNIKKMESGLRDTHEVPPLKC